MAADNREHFQYTSSIVLERVSCFCHNAYRYDRVRIGCRERPLVELLLSASPLRIQVAHSWKSARGHHHAKQMIVQGWDYLIGAILFAIDVEANLLLEVIMYTSATSDLDVP